MRKGLVFGIQNVEKSCFYVKRSCFAAVASNEAQHCNSIMLRALGQRLPTPLTMHLHAN